MPLMILLSAAIFGPVAKAQTIPWNTNGAGIWYVPGGVNVGIGTSTPGATLDLTGSNYKLSTSSAVQEFTLAFPSGTSNAIDVYFGQLPWGQSFWGVLDLELTDTYSAENDIGIIHKRYYLGLYSGPTVFMNQSRVLDEGGTTHSHYSVSEMTWDSSASKFKITIAHLTGGAQAPQLRLTEFAQPSGVGYANSVLSATPGAVYSTGSTVFPEDFVNYNDAVGFGTPSPDQQVDIRGNIGMGRRAQAAVTRYVGIQGTDGSFGGTTGTTGLGISQAASGDTQLQFFTGQWGVSEGPRVTIDRAGTVGIGTTVPCSASNAPSNCKLSVAGAIQAKEVVVNTGWSDYVFAPGYKLAPLSEVATYVQENHHLPDIPSATDVAEKGVSLGDMQAKLLAKVEELTLHMIESDEANKRLKDANQELQTRITRLEAVVSGDLNK